MIKSPRECQAGLGVLWGHLYPGDPCHDYRVKTKDFYLPKMYDYVIFNYLAIMYRGGSVVRNPPANAGDTDLTPGPGRSHMPQSN